MKNAFIASMTCVLLFAACSSPSKRKMELQNNHEETVIDDNKKPSDPSVDTEGPEIRLVSPSTDTRGFVVVNAHEEKREVIKVSGSVSDPSGVGRILINNKRIFVDSKGSFYAEILPTTEQILVEAYDTKGNKSEMKLLLSSKSQPVSASRYALVIGNANYEGVGSLKNPRHDAKAVSECLSGMGFTVSVHYDLSLEGFKEAVDRFGQSLPPQAVALFYYAGHGMQVKGENYLMPTDAQPSSEADAEYKCLNMGRVLGSLEDAKSSVNILILDACRNNPFMNWSRAVGSKGLAPMSAPAGSIIIYAADANQVAMDGTGENGLFTEQLLVNMRIPNLKIEEVLKKTRAAVIEKSDKKQEPAEYNKLTGDFYFVRSSPSI